MKRIILPIIIIVVIAVLIMVNLNQGGGEKVRAEKVHHGTLSKEVEGSGSLRAKAQVDISSQVIGRVTKIHVKEGDDVKKGDLLVSLDDVGYRAEYTQARARLDEARRSYKRAEQLHNEKLIADEELENAKLSLAVAQAQFDQSRDQLEKTKIRAPISGKVLAINVEVGETVMIGTMNNAGTVLLTLADLGTMVAEIEVGETEIPAVKIGQKGVITIDAIPDTSFPGRVVKVGYMPISTLTTLERTTDFEVEIEMENPGPLRPGMSADADIMTETRDSILIIPIQAITKKKDKGKITSFVFVYADGKAVKKKIKTGINSDQEIEVTEGLKEGDLVITGPYRILSKLKGGEQVEIEAGKENAPGPDQAESRPRLRKLRRATRK